MNRACTIAIVIALAVTAVDGQGGPSTRVVQEFADQRSAADEARARLVALRPAPTADPRTPSTRQAWSGPAVGPFGAPSPDGRRIALRLSEGSGTGEIWVMDNLLPAASAPAIQRGRSR